MHQFQYTSLENWKFCAYAFYDYSILISMISFFIQKRVLKAVFLPITEQQLVEFAKMLSSDRLINYFYSILLE